MALALAMARHKGARDQREWQQYASMGLAYLQIGAAEVEAWVDELYPAFEELAVAGD